MKIILSTVAALMLSVAALSIPADAACWAGPNGWHCWHPHHDWQWRHHRDWDHDRW
jgi:Spy/CpxP family protein refolding chaperone